MKAIVSLKGTTIVELLIAVLLSSLLLLFVSQVLSYITKKATNEKSRLEFSQKVFLLYNSIMVDADKVNYILLKNRSGIEFGTKDGTKIHLNILGDSLEVVRGNKSEMFYLTAELVVKDTISCLIAKTKTTLVNFPVLSIKSPEGEFPLRFNLRNRGEGVLYFVSENQFE